MPELITDEVAFHAVLEQAAAHDRYAIDTGSTATKTYFLQVSGAVGLGRSGRTHRPARRRFGPMAELLDSGQRSVMHAGTQDLGSARPGLRDRSDHVVRHPGRRRLPRDRHGLARAAARHLPRRAACEGRLPAPDWLQRPLTNDQLAYAAGDVDNLLDLAGLLEGRLADLGRPRMGAIGV
ncbi:MAG: hypothetical protein R2710_28705 [Acidimicrobiales bacterium]